MHPILAPLLALVAPVFATNLVYEAQSGPLTETVALSGGVEPKTSETVKSKWYVMIKRMPVNLGQLVKKGDLLAEVETEFLNYHLAYLKQMEKLGKSRLEQAKFDEQMVASRKERVRSLASKKIVAASELDKADLEVLAAQVRRLGSEKEMRELYKQMEEVQTQIRDANFYAPIDGVVSELVVNPKQIVGSFTAYGDSKIARIDQPGLYTIRAIALDTQVAFLGKGDKGRVAFDGEATPLEGRILSINPHPQAKEKPSTFEVTIEFSQKGPLLPRGILARIEFDRKLPGTYVTVPWTAIIQTPTKTSVQVVTKEGDTSEREVTLGPRTATRVAILQGLKAQEKVTASLW